ncbi:hypothetical protein RN001_002981 [Aquatica leii]|uniref:aralkylamine N-acetyltransferase n=1 Tax=Aquatica leii TaxID=1421715 RepID=A0AAN7SSY0_9COLE|nr:hypothetical protein RN001_002981 [Aquatica leii]
MMHFKSVQESSTLPTNIRPGSEHYEIRAATENDSEAIVYHLRKFFFKDEPLNVAVELTNSEKSSCEELESYSLKSICEGTSLMAITSSNYVIGVCLNANVSKNEICEEEKAICPKFAMVKKFLDYSGNEGTKAISKQFPNVDKIMLVKIVSTDSAWRGKGIAKELLDKSRKIGQQLGYGLMRVDCSSYYSAKAVARLGFQCVYELKYEDYKENGQPVFKTKEPHSAFSVYVQKIG